MTKQQIKHLFQHRYNQNNWKQFLSQVFTNTRLLTTPEILTGINTDVATQAIRLGYIVLNEDGIERHIAIYDVTLAKGIVLERNRVGLRNLLRKYWKDLDAAFIVYHRPDTSTSSEANWRFTYVSELTGFDAEGELIKVKTEPKRYTYILGEGESCHTAAERFAIIAKKGSKATLDDVKDAFSVEKLSKAFFEEYKEHYENFAEFLTGKRLVKSGSKWKEKQTGNSNPQLAYIFNGDEKEARDFNKKLLGRIVFLYFIQKKGWLGVPEKSAWGQGDPDFIWNLFDNCNNKGIFYSEYLSSLFFDTLNNPNRPNLQFIINNSSLGKVPFLNGGLFEEDNKKYRDLIFPAELFENLFKFFNRYNFTIYEDDPNDHTVAVDPEMLGHIFENLLEDNKDKGAYYTPKEIVHYMCQESLIEYLCTTLEIEDEVKEKEAITALLKNKEIDEILKPEFENINKALDKVKICDPAIGSGAFPMGLLKEIFAAKQTIYTFMHGNTAGFDASGIKLNIIQNSIYGVDIEKGAVDIARLRFWLSLVVDEDEPKALPNLDYKIVVGNSLVSKLGDDIIDIDWNLDETSHGLFGQELAKQKGELLERIIHEQKKFFYPESDKHKLAADIRNLKIDLLINQLQLMVKTQGLETQPSGHGKAIAKQTKLYLQTLGWKQQIEKLKNLKTKPEKPLQFFDWKLDFPEVMNEQVIGKRNKSPEIDVLNKQIEAVNRQIEAINKAIEKNNFIKLIKLKLISAQSQLSIIEIELDRIKKRINKIFGEINYIVNKVGEPVSTDYQISSINKNIEEINNLILETNKQLFSKTATKTGFDIVIGNPPYVDSENMTSNAPVLREHLKDIFSTTKGNWDLFVPFIELGIKLNVSKGIFTYIIPNKVLSANYTIELRNYLFNNNILEVRDYSRLNVFKDANVYPITLLIKKQIVKSDVIMTTMKSNEVVKSLNKIVPKVFYKDIFWDKYFFDNKYVNILIKLSLLPIIGKLNNFNILGAATVNEAYLIKEELNDSQHINNAKKLINTGTIDKWTSLWGIKKTQYIKDAYEYPVISDIHLRNINPTRLAQAESPKIIIAGMSKDIEAFIDIDGHYLAGKSTTIILGDIKELKVYAAFLNSKTVSFFVQFNYHSLKMAGGFLNINNKILSSIPFPSLNSNIKKIIISVIDKILFLKSEGKDTTTLEQQIDNLVYKLYELTYEEVKVIDPAFALSEHEYENIRLE